MTGFYYGHDGYWGTGYEYQGYKTKLECANTCMHDCFGIVTLASTGACYHYSDRADLVSANVKLDPYFKAYRKCSGKNK